MQLSKAEFLRNQSTAQETALWSWKVYVWVTSLLLFLLLLAWQPCLHLPALPSGEAGGQRWSHGVRMGCRGARASSHVRSSPAQSTLQVSAQNLSLWELGDCPVSPWDSHQDEESTCVMAKVFCAVQQTLPKCSQEKRGIQCRAAGQRDIWAT